ncbi:MAG: class I SAM-dependent methyltransferase [Promethearchaeia archaeon]
MSNLIAREKNAEEIYNKHAKYYDLENRVMEHIFSSERKLFRSLRGNILEVGVGTGLNLFHYDPSVNLTILDFSPEMLKSARSKIKKYNLNYVKEIREGDIEHLDNYFDKNSFDFVTSTCVFCSVPNPIKGLKKVKKVLRTEGFLVQIEHGLGYNELLNLLLKVLDPLTTNMRGFHLARDQISNLKSAGFKVVKSRNIDQAGIIKAMISRAARKRDHEILQIKNNNHYF